MGKYKKIFFLCLLFLIILFSGCVSKNKIIKNGNFCGIILDENNNPIPNYYVCCFNNSFNKMGTYTNSSGIFFFQNMEIGNYFLSGHKENFGNIENKEFYYDGGSSMLCCQVASLQELLFQIDKCIENKEFEKGLELTNQICVEENQYNHILVLLYKKYLNLKMNDKDAYDECVRQLKKIENDKYQDFMEKECIKYE